MSKPTAAALVLSASNPQLVDKVSAHSRVVAANVAAWRHIGMPYAVIVLDHRGRDRLVCVRKLEELAGGLALALERVAGSTCMWVIDESLQSLVEPLVRADAMGEAQGHA